MKNPTTASIFLLFTFLIFISGCIEISQFSIVPTPNPEAGLGAIVEYSQVVDKQVIPGFVTCDSPSRNEGSLTVLHIPVGVTVDMQNSYVEYIRNTGARGRPQLASDVNPYTPNALSFGSLGGIGADASGALCGVLYHIVFIKPASCQETCSEYGVCNNNIQTRTCSDNCGNIRTESQTCSAPPPPPSKPDDIFAGLAEWFSDLLKWLDEIFGKI